MAPVQFRLMAAIMEQDGYQCELLENCGSQVAELGLKYVHNDTCYPRAARHRAVYRRAQLGKSTTLTTRRS